MVVSRPRRLARCQPAAAQSFTSVSFHTVSVGDSIIRDMGPAGIDLSTPSSQGTGELTAMRRDFQRPPAQHSANPLFPSPRQNKTMRLFSYLGVYGSSQSWTSSLDGSGTADKELPRLGRHPSASSLRGLNSNGTPRRVATCSPCRFSARTLSMQVTAARHIGKNMAAGWRFVGGTPLMPWHPGLCPDKYRGRVLGLILSRQQPIACGEMSTGTLVVRGRVL